MDKSNVLVDLHKHGYETSEMDKANLSPEDYLRYNYALCDAYNFDMYTVCGSHNSTLWAKQVWDIYNKLKHKGKLHLFVQSEFTVDISKVLKYYDKTTNDNKYVFKEIHLLAAAKKGKEKEYFKNTEIYSKWSDMYIKITPTKELTYIEGLIPEKEDDPNFIAIGQFMKGARNKLCDIYCKNQKDRIPFEIYRNTLQNGLTYTEIRRRFIEDSYNYLVKNKLIKDGIESRKMIKKIISTFEKKDPITNKITTYTLFPPFSINDQMMANKQKKPLNYYPMSNQKGLSRLYLADIKMLFGDTAYFCIAHPSTSKIHKKCGIPVSAFKDVDISCLTEQQQKTINRFLSHYDKTKTDYIFTVNDGNGILVSDKKNDIFIDNDILSLVKNQILIKSLDKYASKYGFNIDGIEISPKMFTDCFAYNYTPREFVWQHFDIYSKLNKAINCNSALSDTHLRFNEDAYLIDEKVSISKDKRKYTDSLSYACTKCSWLDLLENGTFDKENQVLEIRPLKRCKGKTKTVESELKN